MTMDLLPPPKNLRWKRGSCESRTAPKRVIEEIGREEPGAYRLTITPLGVTLAATDEVGLFYAAQTLRQIKSQFPKALPCLEIVDWPDYPVRGFYHDVTRGKVPKLSTLLKLAETCAAYKLNHLELYVEHTYAFKKHSKVWRDADPLTADEIRALDARCAELHIDLVPSFNTFGHFYTWIHHKFPELNELERNVSGEPFNWWDRMTHYTLDCQNPKSIALIRELIAEVRPLFRSRFFNICADETFDLGTGKNKALAERVGKGRLYVDFLKQIMAAVKQAGAVPLFWGDVIGKYPELVGKIPKEAIALDWDYSADLGSSIAHLMAQSRRPFYVCPGVQGWNNWLPDYRLAHLNITRFAQSGRQLGASGLLNTDWGDCGHINTLGPTLPGLVIGASAAWNVDSPALTPRRFEAAVSRTVLGDPSGKLMGVLRAATTVRRASWWHLCCALQPHPKGTEALYDADGFHKDQFSGTARAHASALKKIRALAKEAERLLARSHPCDPLLAEETLIGLFGSQVMEELQLVFYRATGRTKQRTPRPSLVAAHVRELDRRLHAVWTKRNKPSEYFRIREVLEAAVAYCERIGRPAKR